jgi:simple sugar transport system ATP-binding protein
MENTIVKLNNIVKTFGDITAISEGHFELRKGEIHSLIGENGAGKSTLMNILYGMHSPDSGEIIIYDKIYKSINPKTAISLKIGMVHQEFMLVNELTVLENIILGFEPMKGIRIDFPAARSNILEYMEKYNLMVPLNKKIIDLSVGEAQRVEILKTLLRGSEILILDEPTAVLTPDEALQLFDILETLKKSGKSIVFISHKLREVMQISDRITVMRSSKYVDTLIKKDTSIDEIAVKMIGKEVFLGRKEKDIDFNDEVILRIENIFVPSAREKSKITGLSLEVRKGEVLGVAGVDGNGQTELVEALTGLREVLSGKIFIGDIEITNLSPKKIRNLKVGHIPEDRNTHGLNRATSVEDNIISTKLVDGDFSNKSIIDRVKTLEYSKIKIKKFNVKPPLPELLTSGLSGGNAQKVVVSREINDDLSVLIAAQPTRGVDIGSIEEIRDHIYNSQKQGVGVLLVSADLEEILTLSDRIAVIFEGKIAGIISVKDATEHNLSVLMTGGSLEKT